MYCHDCIIDTNARADIKDLKMANKENTTYDGLIELSNSIDNLSTELNPTNKGGETVADCLYDIAYAFSRIADALEKIANK